MKLFINNKLTEIPGQAVTLAEVAATQIGTAQPGVAAAVNRKVVRRTDWESTRLNDGDTVIFITAVCGG